MCCSYQRIAYLNATDLVDTDARCETKSTSLTNLSQDTLLQASSKANAIGVWGRPSRASAGFVTEGGEI